MKELNFNGIKIINGILNSSNKDLTTLPESIGGLTSLRELDLRGNKLAALPESIKKLKSLQTLNLSSNHFTTLPESIGELTSLRELYLSNNKLSTLPESIGNLTSLQTLDLGRNQFSTLPELIGNFTSLEFLYLENNQLSTFPDSFSELEDLQVLSLNNNQLTSINLEFYCLRRLSIENNQLTELPDGVLNDCIEEIYIGNNKISKISSFISFALNLYYFELGGNQITKISKSIGCLNSLQYLGLKGNCLEELPKCIFNMEGLTYYISENPITQIKFLEAKDLGVSEENFLNAKNFIGSLFKNEYSPNPLTQEARSLLELYLALKGLETTQIAIKIRDIYEQRSLYIRDIILSIVYQNHIKENNQEKQQSLQEFLKSYEIQYDLEQEIGSFRVHSGKISIQGFPTEKLLYASNHNCKNPFFIENVKNGIWTIKIAKLKKTPFIVGFLIASNGLDKALNNELKVISEEIEIDANACGIYDEVFDEEVLPELEDMEIYDYRHLIGNEDILNNYAFVFKHGNSAEHKLKILIYSNSSEVIGVKVIFVDKELLQM